jgi:hypothetical protein
MATKPLILLTLLLLFTTSTLFTSPVPSAEDFSLKKASSSKYPDDAFGTFLIVLDTVNGFAYSVFSELKQPEAASCINVSYKAIDLYNTIKSFADGSKTIDFLAVLYLIKDVLVFAVVGYEDCKVVYLPVLDIIDIFTKFFKDPSAHWVKLLSNLASTSIGLYGDIMDMIKHFGDEEYYKIGEIIGTCVYDTFFLKMY